MQEYESEVHINDYLTIIRRRKGVVITFFFITVLIVTAVSFLMKPVYRATVTLLIDVESPPALAMTPGSVALGYSNYYAYKEYFQSQKEIIKSRRIARQVFRESKVEEMKGFLQGKDSIKEFLKKVKVEPVRDTRLLLVHVDNENPQIAADIANKIAKIHVAQNLAYITKSEVMNLLKNEYLKLQIRLSEFNKIYKHRHPKILRLKEEIKQIARRINEEKERSSGGSDYMLYSSAKVNPDSSSSVLSGLKANNISIQQRAEAPIIPLIPKKRLNILLAVLVGFFGGVGLAFLFEYLDDTVKAGEEIEKIVKWPFLGDIPRINGGGNITELTKDLFVQVNPRDPVSEAYRAIRTSILFSSTEEHPLKTIIITSPGPQEGKTTTLCNLGIALAQSQRRILLVEADMRKSRLHEIFRCPNQIGLSNFLSGQVNDVEALVQKTAIYNLFLVSSGPHPPNPSELLASRKIKEFIDIVKERFDFILFDTPPMAVVTDTVILSRVVDGTIMVMESGKTNRRSLPRINQILKDARARVIGALLNKISPANSSYHYYSYYYGKSRQD